MWRVVYEGSKGKEGRRRSGALYECTKIGGDKKEK